MPRWVPLVDAAAVALVVLSAAVAAGGGFRVSAGIARISVMSAWMPLVLGIGLVLVRHAIVRRPSLLARLAGWTRRLTAQDGWRAAWAPFVLSRAGVLIVGALAMYTIGIPADAPQLRVSENELVNLPLRWDAGWYMSVARVGYMWTPRDVGRQQNIAFFPAFPMAMRVVGRVVGGSGVAYLYGGLVVSLVAFLWALMLLFQLARDELGDAQAAAAAVTLLAAYPFSVFHGAVYTESLFLLSVLGAVIAFGRGRWGHAAIWGTLAGLTRANGCFLTVTLATLALTARVGRRTSRPAAGVSVRELAAIIAPVAGAAIYWAFIWQFTGNPFQWSEQHEAWGRTFDGFAPLAAAGDFAAHGVQTYIRAHPYDVMNAVPTILALAAAIPIGIRLGWAYSVFIVTNLVPPLLVGGFMSTGRLTATLFPLFLWLGAVTKRSTPAVVLVFAILQGLMAVLFYTWRPPY